MNYDFISTERTLPAFYKYIGFGVVFISIIITLYFKIFSTSVFLGLDVKTLQLLYFVGLMATLFSRYKTDDERSQELKLQVIKLGYTALMFFILFIEVGDNNDRIFNFENLFLGVLSLIGLQSILYIALQRTRLSDYISNRATLFQFVVFCTPIGFFFVNQWLWAS